MEKKEENNGYITMDKGATWGKLSIDSKVLKYSKLELAWRVGITVAVIVLICLSV